MLMMAELIWECLIISIVLLFGINIGLAKGLTKLPKRTALTISISYGVIILILSTIANFYISSAHVVNDYIPEVLGIIGIIIILSGLYTIDKWKKSKGEYDSFSSTATLSSSICCFVGFTFVFTLLSKSGISSFLEISAFMALALILLIFIFYLFSKFLRNAESPYPILLGNFMILNGFYFLISAAFIPNITKLSSLQTSALSISSDLSSLIFLITGCIGVFLLGAYLKGEGITKLDDITQKLNLPKFNKTRKT
jgi:predicted transporter